MSKDACRYLFFDIECCNGRDICSFGYCLTDGDFSILKQEDILINPKKPFILSRRGEEPSIKLSYSREAFNSAPAFPSFYRKLKSLLLHRDAPDGGRTVVVGHSVSDDVNYINVACERYKLPFINYSFADSQILYSGYTGAEQVYSLESICQALSLPPEILHRSDADAKMAMLTVRELCRLTGLSLPELIEKHPKCQGKVTNGVIFSARYSHYRRFCERVRQLRPKNPAPDSYVRGKRICFSQPLEKADVFKMWTLVKLLIERGARYTTRPDTAHLFIRHPEKQCRRLKAALNEDARFKPAVLTPEELLRTLNITESDLRPADPAELYND